MKKYTNLNAEPIRLPNEDGLQPIQLETTYVNVNGREEHEALLRDSVKCKELGLDQSYEIMVYLKRWGSWLKNETLP